MWLISEAAWKDRTRRIGTRVVELKRGQLCASLRYMAERWGWHRSSVDRFLGKLCKWDMTETLCETGITVITICNYDEYQKVGLPNETREDEKPRHERDKTETLNNNTTDYTAENAREIFHPKTEEVIAAIESPLRIDRDFVPPEWMGARYRVSAGLNAGWRPDVIISSVKAQAARKHSPPQRFEYYERGIAEAHARADAPLPEIPKYGGQVGRSSETLTDVAKRLSGQVIDFGPRPGGIRSDADGAAVRLLSQGGRERS